MTAEIVSLAKYRLARTRDAAEPHSALFRPKQPSEVGRGSRMMLSRRANRWADHRGEPRHVVEGKCVPALSVNDSAATLKNVSRNGLMAATSRGAPPGSRVLVTIAGGRSLSALVIWNHDGLMGLEVPIGSMELASS